MLDLDIWPDTAAINEWGHLVLGGCDTIALAREHGTPLYLLDEATFRRACRTYRDACARHYAGPSAVHYASKALLNTALVQLVAAEGLGLDVVSGGELYVALHAGFPPQQIHLHGNAKTRAELELALAAGVGRVVVDTLDELALLAGLSARRAAAQPIMLRLAPDIAADTHAHIETGRASSKFGLPLDALDAAADQLGAAPGLRLTGLHAHLGSQLFDYAPIERAIGVLLDCAARLRDRHGITIDEISPGGGLGVPYTTGQPAPDVDAYVAAIGRALEAGCVARGMQLPRLVIEPGRSLIARAVVALYTVVASKQLPATDHRPPTTDHRPPAQLRMEDRRWKIATGRRLHSRLRSSTFSRQSSVVSHRLSVVGRQSSVVGGPAARYLHVDGGMADNIRPALYGARYTALLANRAGDSPEEIVHVAGRYCESGDVLLRDIALPYAAPGDVLAVAVAGAYTLSMASTYNLVPRPALLLVAGGLGHLIQRRETYADLLLRDLPLSHTET